MKTFDVHHYDINEQGDVAVFSYFLQAMSWEHAEEIIPATHWVDGCVVATVDEQTGVQIDFDNLN